MKYKMLLLVLSFLICGCTIVNSDPIDMDSKNINRQIELTIIPEWNTFKKEDPITVSIKNTSDEIIIFPYDYGVRIFLFVDGNWVEIQEKEMLTKKEPISIIPGSTHHYSIFGDFYLQEDDILTRIYVIGQLEKNEKQAAGYIELILH
jgi:archaellum component FlaG (FlaF/FlaG flagellin family)